MQVLKRTFLVELPLLLILIPLPFIQSDHPILYLNILGIRFTISLMEVIRITVIMLRSWLIILSMVLFTMTTPPDEMLSSLSAMQVPAVLISIILFMWRYLSLFLEQVHNMSIARELRSIPPLKGSRHKKPGIFWNMKYTGSMLGSLFVRAYERSERIYQAMLLRGFDGSIRTRFYERLNRSQILQIIIIAMMALCFIIGAYGIYGK